MGKDFLDAQTKTCSNCHGAGELLEIEKDGQTTWTAGDDLWEKVDRQGWELTDSSPKECQQCNGFGTLNDP